MNMRESFQDWWDTRGNELYASAQKDGLWVVFSDAWYRASKENKKEDESKKSVAPDSEAKYIHVLARDGSPIVINKTKIVSVARMNDLTCVILEIGNSMAKMEIDMATHLITSRLEGM